MVSRSWKHMLDDLWFSEPISVCNHSSKSTLFTQISGDAGDQSALLTAVKSSFAWKMQKVNAIILLDPEHCQWLAIRTHPSVGLHLGPVYNRYTSSCISAIAQVSAKWKDMTETQRYHYPYPGIPMTCLPIYSSVLPLQRIHLHRELRASSFREVVLVSFHRLSTFPGEAPTHNDPTLTFSCVSVLKRWRAEILALYKGIFACSERALLRTTVLLPRSRLWQGEELYFQDTRAELLVSLTTTEQFSAPNYAFTVVHLFFIITKE